MRIEWIARNRRCEQVYACSGIKLWCGLRSRTAILRFALRIAPCTYLPGAACRPEHLPGDQRTKQQSRAAHHFSACSGVRAWLYSCLCRVGRYSQRTGKFFAHIPVPTAPSGWHYSDYHRITPGRNPQDAVSLLAKALRVSSFSSQLSSFFAHRHHFWNRLDTLRWPHPGGYSRYGCQRQYAHTRRSAAAGLFTGPGDTVSITRPGPGPDEKSAEVAEATPGQD